MKKILLILAVALLLEIPSVYATDETENVEINTEDIIISGLITNAPKKIKIYNEEYCINKEFIQTIKSVFGERVETHRSYNNILKK